MMKMNKLKTKRLQFTAKTQSDTKHLEILKQDMEELQLHIVAVNEELLWAEYALEWLGSEYDLMKTSLAERQIQLELQYFEQSKWREPFEELEPLVIKNQRRYYRRVCAEQQKEKSFPNAVWQDWETAKGVLLLSPSISNKKQNMSSTAAEIALQQRVS